MDLSDIPLEDLECSPEAMEWIISTGITSLEDLIAKFPDPNDDSQSEFQSASDEILIGDNICHAIGLYVWQNLG